jgi:hypothetical protein
MMRVPGADRAFVSSTFEDLKRHRQGVIDALRNAGLFVDPMENWQSEADEPTRFSLDRLKDCDVCILLVAYRRGSIPTNSTESITQLEYSYAIEHGIEVLPFLLEEDTDWNIKFDERDKDPRMRDWRALLRSRAWRPRPQAPP